MDDFYVALGEYLIKNIVFIQVFLFFLVPTITFLVFLPKTFQVYLIWKANQKPSCFSLTILLGSFSFTMLATTYPSFLSKVIQIHRSLNNLAQITLFMSVFFLLNHIFIPLSLSYFKKLKAEKRTLHFSLFCLFAFISFYGLSILLAPILNVSIASAM